MKQKHILFDLDGTIVRSDLGITKGVQKSLEHFGIYEELDDLKKFVDFLRNENLFEYFSSIS